MSSDASPKSAGSWFLRGVRPTEQPQVVHAAEPRGGGLFAALCDSKAVATVPGRFDPAEDGACEQCCKLAT